MRTPLLRYVACHRGVKAGALQTAKNAFPAHYERVKTGPLRGCFIRHTSRGGIFKFGRGFALEFKYVIRVDPENRAAMGVAG